MTGQVSGVDPLVLARALIGQGVPVFVARSDPGSATGFFLPRGWQNTKPNPRLLEAWRPGMALCAVTGIALDVINIDPRNGGDKAWESFLSDHPSPRVYAEVATPSGGRHLYVARTRHGKVSRDGIDLQAGDDNGQGRGFVFLPGTVRPSKVDGQPRPYVLVTDRLDTFGQDDDTGRDFLAWVTSERNAPTVVDGLGTLAPNGIAGGLGEPITANHDNTLAARTASLVRRGYRIEEAWAVMRACIAQDVVGGDPARPFTRADFDRWWSGAARKYTPTDAPLIAPENGDDEPGSTWDRVDLTSFLDGTHDPERATLMPRSDGHGLFYPGRVHDLHGESESGKSWVAQAEAARLINEGRPVLYLDFESDPGAVVQRLVLLGADPALVGKYLDYRRPDGRPSDRYWSEIVGGVYTLAVVDGVTDALGTFGASIVDNDEVARFMRLVVRPLTRTGAAVALIDHVAKSTEGRGRFAIGAQAKLAGLDGASYVIEPVTALAPGQLGVLEIRVAKDRPGAVRAVAGPYRASDRTQLAARFVLDSREPGRVTATLDAPDPEAADRPFRPTNLMERASRFVESNPDASTRAIRDGVGGRGSVVDTAIAVLIAEGFIEASPGPRSATQHRSVRPYRHALDPQSDTYAANPLGAGTRSTPDPSPQGTATVSVSIERDTGHGRPEHFDRVRDTVGTRSDTVTDGETNPDKVTTDQVPEPDRDGQHCTVCGARLLLADGRTVCGRCEPVTRATDWSGPSCPCGQRLITSSEKDRGTCARCSVAS